MSYAVTAKPWKGGWELHITDIGVTQSRTLPTAEQAVRDYIATICDLDEVTDPVEITVALEGGGSSQGREMARDR